MEAWQVHFKWSHFPLFRNSLGCHMYIHGHIICISGSSSFFFPDSFLYQEIKGWDQWLHCTANFLRNIFQKPFRYKASEMILKPAPCPGIRPNYHIIHQRYAGALGAQRCQGQLLLPRSYHSVAGQVPIHTELVSNRSFWESTLGRILKMNSKPVQNHCSLFPLPFWTWVYKRDENYPKTKERKTSHGL